METMETIEQIVNQAGKGLMTSGVRRMEYKPYKIETALYWIEKIGLKFDAKFIMTEDVLPVYSELVKYFQGDPSFDGDLTKGILIMGPTGTGKSLAMMVMSIFRQIDNIIFLQNGKTIRLAYDIVNVNDINAAFQERSVNGLDTYCKRAVLCIDEIGNEVEQVKYFGNNLDAISYVLYERHIRRLLTFGTTNLTGDALKTRYDDRIVSRMYEQFNFLVMNGKDFRKENI